MSRAEVHAFGSGSPEALVQVEWVIPSAFARRVSSASSLSADPFRGGVRLLITGAHGFQREVTFGMDE